MTSKGIRQVFVESLKNPIYLNNYYKANGQNEYRNYILQPSKCGNNIILIWGAIFLMVLQFPIIVLCQAIKSLIGKIKSKKNNINRERKVMICVTSDQPATKLLKNAGIPLNEVSFIVPDYKNFKTISNANLIPLYGLITFKDILKSIYNSLISYYNSLFQYGLEITFLGVNVYDWFINYYALKKIPITCELLFYHQLSIQVPLIDALPHKRKTLLQHGTVIFKYNPNSLPFPILLRNDKYSFWTYNIPNKYKSLNKIYAFSDEDYDALKMSICCSEPQKFIVGYLLKTIPISKDRPVVLIIGYYKGYGDREISVLKALTNLNVKVYIKNHPSQDKHVYDKFLTKYRFSLIEGSIFPDANIVISYQSTLAREYEHNGYKVLYYDEMDFENINEEISKYL